MPHATTEPRALPPRPRMWRLLLIDLEPGECRWPVDRGRRGQIFCAAATGDSAVSYCSFHRAIAYQERRQ